MRWPIYQETATDNNTYKKYINKTHALAIHKPKWKEPQILRQETGKMDTSWPQLYILLFRILNEK